MFIRHHNSFQKLWQAYPKTGSVVDLAERPERRVITAHQDIHIQHFYIRRRLVIAKSMSQTIFWFTDVTFPLPRLTDKNRDTLVMQNNARLPQGLLLRCSKTTTSESMIDQRVVLNEHVWAEVDRRRKPQRDNVHIEAGGVHCLKLKIPPEVCNVNEEQICENEFQHLGAMKWILQKKSWCLNKYFYL